MTARSLSDYPDEMLLAFIEKLSLSDLVAVSMASQSLRRLAKPRIYSHIHMEWSFHHHPSIFLLLRSLLENPELCSHVRSLKLDGEFFIDDFHSYPRPDALPNVIALPSDKLSIAIMSTGVSQDIADDWKEKTELGVADAIVALLVSVLPNLASISLDSNWTIESRFLGHMFRSALCKLPRDDFHHQIPAFESLTDVSLAEGLERDEHTEEENAADMLALFYLPNIQHLSASIGNPNHFAWPSQDPPAPSTLTSLELRNIRECRIEPVLSLLTNLRSFDYQWFYQPNIDAAVSDDVLRLDMMAAAIAKCHTLTELTITALILPDLLGGMIEPPDVTLHGSLAELSQLPQLKRLTVPWMFLMGMEETSSPGSISSVLPYSLEHLRFTDCLSYNDGWGWMDEKIVSAIKLELEKGAMNSLQSLKSIVLMENLFLDATEECKSELKCLNERFNLDIVIPPEK